MAGAFNRCMFRAAMYVGVCAATAACAKVSVDLSGRECEAGQCVAGYTCHPETGRCVPEIRIGCDGDAVCPNDVTTGATCPAAGVFFPCDPRYAGCDGGCRTCDAEFRWTDCSARACIIGDVHSCGSCDDDCTVRVLGATAACQAGTCTYVGECDAVAVDLDGDATNGCECERAAAEVCNGEDDDCDGVIDEEDDSPCGAGEVCESGVCIPCGATDPLRCGSGCLVCSVEIPDCSSGICVCNQSSCMAGSWCAGSNCVLCGDSDPVHCGPTCDFCAGQTPICFGGTCVCDSGSCIAQASCLPDGGCGLQSASSTISVDPVRVDADGVSGALVTVTLIDDAGGSPLTGKAVVIYSDRPQDVISQPTALSDGAGQVLAAVRSSTPGVAKITALNVTDYLGVEQSATIAFVPVVGLVAHYPFDAPTGRQLAPGDLGGVADTNLAALWGFEGAAPGWILDATGVNSTWFGEDDDFEAPYAAPWVGVAIVEATNSIDDVAPATVSDWGGNAALIATGGGIELTVSSTGAGSFNRWNTAYLAQWNPPYLWGDFDLQIDYEIPTAPVSSLGYHVYVRLYVGYAGGSRYTLSELGITSAGFFVRGLVVPPVASPSEARVYSPPLAGKLRVVRQGATHSMYYWDQTDWSLVHEIINGDTGPVTALILAAYSEGGEAYSVSSRLDNFRVNQMPTRVGGVIGRGLSFDGVDDWLGSDTASMTFGTQITLEAWFKAQGGGESNPRLVEMSTAGTVSGHALAYDPDGTLRAWADCAGDDTRVALLTADPVTFVDDRWHHLAYTFDGATARLYIDGNERSSRSGSCADLDDVGYYSIGGYYRNSSLTYDGELDGIAIFNIALSPVEVADHHRRGVAPDVIGGLDGALSGPVSFAGLFGEALVFDGVDARVEVPGVAATAGDFTLTMWLATLTGADPGTRRTIVTKLGGVPESGFDVALDGDDASLPVARFVSAGIAVEVASSVQVIDGAWHHLAVTVAGSQRCLWVDSVASCVTQVGSLDNVAPTQIGGDSGVDPGFAGVVDAVKGFDVVLGVGAIAAEATPP